MKDVLKQANAASNAMVIALGVFHLLTYVVMRHQQLASYRFFMWAVVLNAGLRLSHAVGAPQLKPFSAQALMAWLQRVMSTSDAHYLLVGFAFQGHRPLPPLMVSPFLLASLRLASFLKQQMPSLQSYVDPLLAKKEDVFHAMATADIVALPILTAFSLLRRSFLTPLVYTFMLKQRYNSATGAKYHQPVWKRFDELLDPYLVRLPPQALQVVAFVKQWFTKPPQA